MTTPPFFPGSPVEISAVEAGGARANVDLWPTLATRLAEFLPGHPCGRQRIANPAAVATLQVPPDALSALLQVQDAPVRFTLDGTAPAAAVGQRAAAGDTIELTGWITLKAFQVVNEGAGAAAVEVVYLD